MSHPHDYIHVAFQKNRLKLPPKNCWEICLQIDLKSSMETKMEQQASGHLFSLHFPTLSIFRLKEQILSYYRI